jgi:SulP family sulfate permease
MNALTDMDPHWLRRYRPERLAGDVVAGIVVAALVLPQSLAYPLLAGLPPQAGLYVSIFPVVAYALVGSCMTQAIGPVAITAIMTYAVLSPIAAPGSGTYLALAALLSLASGLLMLACGLLRLGFLAQLLSRPVVSGFISGSAVLIVISQLKIILGVHAPGTTAGQALATLIPALPRTNVATFVIGLATMAALMASRRWLAGLLTACGMAPTAARFVERLTPLAVIAAATALVATLDLDATAGVAVVGTLPTGLPPLGLTLPGLADLGQLAVPAVVLALVGMVQNISMAQALASRRHERVDPSREMVGLGIANIVASCSGGMPVGSGVSRTAINVAAGAETPLAGIVTAAVILVIAVFGAAAFERLPLSVLAANIVVAALAMIDVATLRRVWRYDRADGAALLATAAGVIFLGLQEGIILGVGLSLVAVVARASRPAVVVVGRLAGSEHFRSIERYDVETLPGVLFLRIDEALFFGNLAAVEARISAEIDRDPAVADVVLVLSAVNRIDATAMELLADIATRLADRSVRLHLAEVKAAVREPLVGTPLWRAVAGRIHLSANTAFIALADRRA